MLLLQTSVEMFPLEKIMGSLNSRENMEHCMWKKVGELEETSDWTLETYSSEAGETCRKVQRKINKTMGDKQWWFVSGQRKEENRGEKPKEKALPTNLHLETLWTRGRPCSVEIIWYYKVLRIKSNWSLGALHVRRGIVLRENVKWFRLKTKELSFTSLKKGAQIV